MTIPLTAWETFYGLHARPFSLTPDLRFAFQSASHTHALDEVTMALRRREGVVVVTGEVGTGKTMLCRTLLTTFERRTFLSVILDPFVTVEELLTHVLTDFGLITPADAMPGPATDATRHRLVETLHRFLASLIPLDAQAVILIDEAQHLNPIVLEQIRLLANFETDEAKLLQIVLVGQPSLDDVLNRADMRQLSQRIARRCELKPLSDSEVREYVERRLAVASENPAEVHNGDKPLGVAFAADALDAVAAYSGGIPRVVNTLCDRTLQAAFARQIRVMDRGAVDEGARHLKLQTGMADRADTAGRAGTAGKAGVADLAGLAGVDLAITAGTAGTADLADTAAMIDLAITPGTVVADPAPPVRRTPARLVPVAAAIVIVTAVGAAAWYAQLQSQSPRDTSAGRPASAVADPSPAVPAPPPATPLPVLPPSAVVPPAASTETPPSRATETPPRREAAGAETATTPTRYEISVAAFRTQTRAGEVAGDLTNAKLPVSTRLDSTGRWYLVMVGPYQTATDAEAARATLLSKGFADARIISNPVTR